MLFLLLATIPFSLGLKPADISALSDLPLPKQMPCDTIDDGYVCDLEKTHVWGKESPFHSTGSEDSRKPPPGCKVIQVSLLGRHGVRGGFAKENQASRNKVRLEILKNLLPEVKKKYPFFEEEVPVDPGPDLQPLGRHQAVNTGIRLAQDYPALAKKDTPVVRSSSSTRVLETALYVMRGFEDRRRELIDDLEIEVWKPNDLTEANTVVGSAYIPPLEEPEKGKWEKYGDWVRNSQKKALDEMLGVELPVYDLEEERKYCYDQVKNWANWANTRFKTEADVEAAAEKSFQRRQSMHLGRQITYLDSYCRSNTLLSTEGTSISQWCNLFTSEYFNDFIDYSESAHDWLTVGPGNPTLPTQVELWVKELCARMLGHEEGIFTVGTGASPFNRKIYIDLTHYENIYPALAILGLIDTSDPPSFDHHQAPPKRPRTTTTGATIPMGARLIVEVLDCSSDVSLRARAGSRRAPKDDSELFVRFILNDGVRKVTHLTDDGPGPGVYTLRSVLEMVKKSLGNQ